MYISKYFIFSTASNWGVSDGKGLLRGSTGRSADFPQFMVSPEKSPKSFNYINFCHQGGLSVPQKQ